jgi:hypothetical protein
VQLHDGFDAIHPTLSAIMLAHNRNGEEELTHHAQMTPDEWVETMLSDSVYVPPKIPPGTVVAYVTGGTYWATVDEVNKVLHDHYTPSGTKLRGLVIERSNSLDGDEMLHQQTVEFYADATAFELAVILAWFDSTLNGATE